MRGICNGEQHTARLLDVGEEILGDCVDLGPSGDLTGAANFIP
jgi:hypothetical protein